ncbi:MAG: hypothetical protein A2275_01280 [Bacteroidetes bacterium RIFOXYA12_FULL_35_11]|nr:MAG: hypothetical protein A2X01_18600 [Bacteroidetes bacterium GWF2_35_48]OFY75778.1 MAG: hypothetical protein A2275_01280 [Bacteroidetes bacterium RIFOXYA12_FULL_35_11]OFY94295.1 MAG: hypothetical protein A2309_10790 [Bacteroidetes bacterium RIFOXYB2_FULL_35_7]
MAIMLLTSAKAQVTLPAYEAFNYTVGDSLPPATWSGLNSGDQILIASGNLSYPGFATPAGNKISFAGGGRDYFYGFTTQYSGTVYFSFIMDVTALGTLDATGGYFFGVCDSATNFGATIWAKLNGTGYNIGINSRTTLANAQWGTTVYDINTPVLIVGAYEIVSGAANDIVKLWVNPASGSFGTTAPTPDITYTNTGTDLISLSRVFVRQDSNNETPNIDFDEMRVATNWASVTPAGIAVIPVTSITVTGAGNATTITTAAGTLQMNAAILPANATNQTVTWSITPTTGVASISTSGLLTAIADGVVSVRATANDGSSVFGTVDITISNQPAFVPVTAITVTGQGGASTITTSGGTLQMSAAITPANATIQTITWSMTPTTGMATVSTSGLVTALANGSLTVRATANDGSNVYGETILTLSNQGPAQVSIYNIQYTTNVLGDSPYKDSTITTSGICTGTYSGGYFLQDGNGAWNGVYVYDNVHHPVLGDNVTVSGLVDEYYNLTEIKNVTTYVVTSQGNPQPTSEIVTTGAAKSEQYEGVLIKVQSARCNYYNATGWWEVLQGTDTLTVDKLLYTYATPIVNNYYDVTGVIYYSFSKYRIEPRELNDIFVNTGIESASQNAGITAYPNPASDVITVTNLKNNSIVEISNILGQKISAYSNVKSTELALDLSGLNNGIYFISVKENGKIAKTIKISKK